MSHRGAAHAGRDGWRTPVGFFQGIERTISAEAGTYPDTWADQSLIRRFPGFTIDAAATAGHELCPIAYGPGQGRPDALTRDHWGGPDDRIWINPPFSGLSSRGGGMVGPWALRIQAEAKRAAAGELGALVALVPGVVDTYWAQMLLKSAPTVIAVRGRLSFRDPVSGEPARGNVVGSLVLVWGLEGCMPQIMGVDKRGARLW